MHIKSIEIKNFRRFDQYRCEPHERMTLLIGPNGSGKTSLLRAIYLGFAGASTAFQLGMYSMEDRDVRYVDTLDPGNERWRTPVFPASIKLELEMDGHSVLLANEKTASSSSLIPELDKERAHEGYRYFLEQASTWFDPSSSASAPLFARFGASSTINGIARSETLQRPFEKKREVWERAQSDSISATGLAQWFQYNELRTLQEKSPPLAYRVAREAALSAIHAEDIMYVIRDNQLMLKHADQGWRPFDQLSDGQRRIAAIFCELAMRCAALNSHLGEKCIEQTSGVVTIDELDLHLHPAWQRTIISDLCRAFPRLQFIVASHSPFLLQATQEIGLVINAATGEPVQFTDSSIEDITESVMGVNQPQRSKKFLELKEAAQEFYELLERPKGDPEEEARLKEKLDQAMAPFANDPASAAWLEQRRAAAGR
jgi:energy-coupling factor transporter ATP-binding protein EcfA2